MRPDQRQESQAWEETKPELLSKIQANLGGWRGRSERGVDWGSMTSALRESYMHHPRDRAPALVGLLWGRYGMLPRNLILVEVIHPKVPYIHENRYHVTVFDRDKDRGSVIGVELRFGFMEEPNVERYLEDLARHKQIDLPSDPRQWIVHVSHEHLLPAKRMNLFKRLRFRLFLFLRVVSRPAYYAYGLGDGVQLSAEIMPVRVR
jgi:KUP system potassium uptake protein